MACCNKSKSSCVNTGSAFGHARHCVRLENRIKLTNSTQTYRHIVGRTACFLAKGSASEWGMRERKDKVGEIKVENSAERVDCKISW